MTLSSQPEAIERGRLRRAAAVIGVIVAVALVAACADDGDETGTDGPAGGSVAAPADFATIEVPELNPDARQVEIAGTAVEAQPWDDVWVGTVTDDLFIGLRIDNRNGGSGEVTAYLCDNELSVLLDGELDGSDALLTGDVAEIELQVADGAVTGTVTLAGEEPATFTAEPATGPAGVYVAEHEQDGVEAVGRWIVLADGDQRGSGEVRCFRNPWTGERICRVLN